MGSDELSQLGSHSTLITASGSDFGHIVAPHGEGCTDSTDVNKQCSFSEVGVHQRASSLYTTIESDVIYDVSSGFNRYSHYAPLQVIPDITCETSRRFDHEINILGSQFNIDAWRHELSFETDEVLRQYLWAGVTNGFYIVDQDADIPSYECHNYKSATSGDAYEFVNRLIHDELAQGKYRLAAETPHCIHSLGAVPKKGSNKWRPITDCKRPIGDSVNSFMLTTFRDFCYTTVDQVVDLVTPNCFMCSVDIKAAYRSVLIHPSQWKYQGVSWEIDGVLRYLYDTHVCFGLRCAPYLFTQISNFVLRCLKRRGFLKCVAYLDDFLIICDSADECSSGQEALIEILRSLGFYIAWEKCCSPSQCVTYLGVEFNSLDMSVSLRLKKWPKCNMNCVTLKIKPERLKNKYNASVGF